MREKPRVQAALTAVLGFGLKVAAAMLFFVALSDDVYVTTLPVGHYHLAIVVRKLYSIGAFAVVGFVIARELRSDARATVLWSTAGVSLFSAAIEVAQCALGGREGLKWNMIDILCGSIGGILGASIALLLRPRIRRLRT